MSAASNCRLIGRWRIVEADLWDRDYLDLVDIAVIIIEADGHGEIAFGAMQATLGLGYSPSMVSFTLTKWTKSRDGHAELLGDDSIQISFAYDNGDEAC